MSSPTFDFSFERPESDLSEEAQKIMDSVREEAARIKVQMLEERDKQKARDGEVDQLYGIGGRKIAKPKGKAGRFSDIHRQEFQKMDSIANHVSSWKGKLKSEAASLKRSPSKAGLDEHTPKSLPKSKSMRSLHFNTHNDSDNASPGKRMKHHYNDDASAVRPISRDDNGSVQNTPAKIPLGSKLPSAISTPTKASLARSASVKNMKTSMIPMSRSASTRTLASPSAPKSEGSHKYMSSLARLGSMKSILHRSQPKHSGKSADPIEPKTDMDVNKDLPSLPATPSKGILKHTTIKRVDVTCSFDDKPVPSPFRSQIPAPAHHPSAKIGSNAWAAKGESAQEEEDPVTYPLLATSPNITTRRPVPGGTTASKATSAPQTKPESSPGDFTFRMDSPIKFSSPSKPLPPNPKTSATTIRHVRPSGLPTPLASTNNNTVFDSVPLYSGIAHGIGNKKRKHADSDDEDEFNTKGNKENDSKTTQEDDETSRPTKKARTQTLSSPSAPSALLSPVKWGAVNHSSPLKKRRFGTPSAKSAGANPRGQGQAQGQGGKRGISLGRLNVLARPKDRR